MSETPLTDAEREAIRARCEAATPGDHRNVMDSYIVGPYGTDYKIAQLGGTVDSPGVIARTDKYLKHDCRLFANAKRDLLRLLSAHEQLLAEIDRLRAAHADLEKWVREQVAYLNSIQRTPYADGHVAALESVLSRMKGEK